MKRKRSTRRALQALLDGSKFIRHYGFRVLRAADGACTIELPHRAALERPGGIINGPALMAAADCAMWLAPQAKRGAERGAPPGDLPPRAALERPGGIINGPALMAAADCAMWLAIKAKLGMESDALTSELNTAFLAPAKGEHVYCTAEILRLGRRRIYGTARCHGKSGKLFHHHLPTYIPPNSHG